MAETLVTIGFIPKDCGADIICCGDPEESETVECYFKVCELEDGSTIITNFNDEKKYSPTDLGFFDEDSEFWKEIHKRFLSESPEIAKRVSPQALAYAWAFYQDEWDVYDEDISEYFIKTAEDDDGGEFSLEEDYLGKIYFRCNVYEDDEYYNEVAFVYLNTPDA